jgi:hypothetical protein
MPTEVIGATARAASLFAVIQEVTTEAVLTKVAVQTRKVLKAMFLTKLKIITALLMVGLTLAAGGVSFAHRVLAARDQVWEKSDESTKRQRHRSDGPQAGTAESPTALALAQDPLVAQMDSFPFRIDPNDVYEFPELTVAYQDFRLEAGPVSVVPIATERGITGVMMIGNGRFRYTPEKDRLIEGQCRAAMLRFNPEEQAAIVPLAKGKRVSDRGISEMSRHMLQVVIRHCWQSSLEGGRRQEVLIPPRGAFAADLYSKEHGDLLISFDERMATAYDFTDRKTLYEKR